jgi:RHS repeat-associated protein
VQANSLFDARSQQTCLLNSLWLWWLWAAPGWVLYCVLVWASLCLPSAYAQSLKLDKTQVQAWQPRSELNSLGRAPQPEFSAPITLPILQLPINKLPKPIIDIRNAAGAGSGTSSSAATGSACEPSKAGAGCSTDAPAIQSSGSPSVSVGNPLNVITGNKYQAETDLAALPGVLGLEWVRHYNSVYALPQFKSGSFGQGWQHSYDSKLYESNRDIQIVQADGSRFTFSKINSHLCQAQNPQQGKLLRKGKDWAWQWVNGRELLYNPIGQLIQIKARSGQALTLSYDFQQRLKRVIDPQQRELTMHYPDAESKQITRVTSPLGEFNYRYEAGNLIRVFLPAEQDSSRSRQYHYDDRQFTAHLTGITDHGQRKGQAPIALRVSSYLYDEQGRAVLSTSGEPARLALAANAVPLLPKQLAPNTGIEQVHLRFDKPATPTQVGKTVLTNALGQETIYTHQVIGNEYRLLSVRGPGCHRCGQSNVRYEYIRNGQFAGLLTQVTTLDDLGKPLAAIKHQYDQWGRLERVFNSRDARLTKPEWVLAQRYEYNDPNSAFDATLIARPSVVPGQEYQVRLTFNGVGQVKQLSQVGFNPLDRFSLPLSPTIRTTQYQYQVTNHRSLLKQIDGPLANRSKADYSDSDITEFEWDANGHVPTAVIYPGGFRDQFHYDEAGRKNRVIEHDGVRTIETRHRFALHPRRWQDTSETTVRAYFESNAAKLDANSIIAFTIHKTGYDALQRKLKVVDSADREIQFLYDASGRQVGLANAAGFQNRTTLDQAGLPIVNARYRPESAKPYRASYQQFDLLGRLSTQLLPDGRLRQLSYAADGSLKTRISSDGVSQHYAYSPLGRVRITSTSDNEFEAQLHLTGTTATKQINDFGETVAYRLPHHGDKIATYDNAGRLSSMTHADGTTTQYQFNVAGQLIEKTRSTKKSQLASYVRFFYEGRLLKRVTDPNQTIDTEFDAVGRETRQTISLSRVIARHTSAMINKPIVVTTTRTYHPYTGQLIQTGLVDGRILDIHYSTSQSAAELTGLSLRAGWTSSIPKKINRFLAGVIPRWVLIDQIEIDPLNGLASYRSGNGLKTVKTFDSAGRLNRQEVDKVHTLNYGYGVGTKIKTVESQAADTAGATALQLSYSGLGRLLRPESDLIKPQITKVGTAQNSAENFDSLGRIIQDDQYSYIYTSDGQLETVSSLKTGQRLAQYRYNSLRQRVSKTIFPSEQTTYYVWVENRLVAELDQQNQVTSQYLYLHDGRKSVPIVKLEEAANQDNASQTARALFIHTDHRAAPIAMTNTAQKVVWRADLAPSGRAQNIRGDATLNIRLAGQYFDVDTGLHDNLNRSYNPATGRYLQPDPQGYRDGLDPYLYAGADPINKIDPYGLYQIDIHYFMTYFLGIASGIDPAIARTIALAAQYIDDDPKTSPVDVDENGAVKVISSGLNNLSRLRHYHFMKDTLDDGAKISSPEDSGNQLYNLKNAYRNAPTNCSKQILFGEFLHTLADTYSHADDKNMPYAASGHEKLPLEFGVGIGLGHGLHDSDPDFTFNHIGLPALVNKLTPGQTQTLPKPGPFNTAIAWVVNEERSLKAEKSLFNEFISQQTWKRNSAVSFSAIEGYLKQFNAIGESEEYRYVIDQNGKQVRTKNASFNHSDAASVNKVFQQKITFLNDVLKKLNFSINLFESVHGYDQVLAAKNRQTELGSLKCKDLTSDGGSKFNGVILPSESCDIRINDKSWK